jgi:hypothetical protein
MCFLSVHTAKSQLGLMRPSSGGCRTAPRSEARKSPATRTSLRLSTTAGSAYTAHVPRKPTAPSFSFGASSRTQPLSHGTAPKGHKEKLPASCRRDRSQFRVRRPDQAHSNPRFPPLNAFPELPSEVSPGAPGAPGGAGSTSTLVRTTRPRRRGGPKTAAPRPPETSWLVLNRTSVGEPSLAEKMATSPFSRMRMVPADRFRPPTQSSSSPPNAPVD